MTTLGYAAMSAGDALVPYEYDLPPLGSEEVRLAVSHCGICYSDVDLVDDAFKRTLYPIVPGHEIVGVVSDRGSNVKHLEIGQRVGVGPLRHSCSQCECCTTGFEQLCFGGAPTAGSGAPGGFANEVQLSSKFAFAIPDPLPSAMTAPLMCAGLTMYNALNRHTANNMQVALLGVGGLGHVGVQLASKMGHEVTAFDLKPSPEDIQLQKQLGAHHVVDTSDAEKLKSVRNKFDVIISTVHGNLDFHPFIAALRPNGKLCLVGNNPSQISVLGRLVLGQRAVVGVAAGSRDDANNMLEFSARHGIAAVGEVMNITDINAAMDRVRAQDVRFRMVVEV